MYRDVLSKEVKKEVTMHCDICNMCPLTPHLLSDLLPTARQMKILPDKPIPFSALLAAYCMYDRKSGEASAIEKKWRQ